MHKQPLRSLTPVSNANSFLFVLVTYVNFIGGCVCELECKMGQMMFTCTISHLHTTSFLSSALDPLGKHVSALCWYTQILQPFSFHFHIETHVVEKHDAGECAIWQDI